MLSELYRYTSINDIDIKENYFLFSDIERKVNILRMRIERINTHKKRSIWTKVAYFLKNLVNLVSIFLGIGPIFHNLLEDRSEIRYLEDNTSDDDSDDHYDNNNDDDDDDDNY